MRLTFTFLSICRWLARESTVKLVKRHDTNWLILFYSTPKWHIDCLSEQKNQIREHISGLEPHLACTQGRRLGHKLSVSAPFLHVCSARVYPVKLSLAPACSCSPRRAPWQQGWRHCFWQGRGTAIKDGRLWHRAVQSASETHNSLSVSGALDKRVNLWVLSPCKQVRHLTVGSQTPLTWLLLRAESAQQHLSEWDPCGESSYRRCEKNTDWKKSLYHFIF